MTWDNFRMELDECRRSWEALKGASNGALRAYLEQSAIVVTCGRQFEVDDSMPAVAFKCPAFFIDDPVFEKGDVRVSDTWQVEVCFPYVDIDLIEAIKASLYCDKDRTPMRPSSSVVVLKRISDCNQ